MRSPAVGTPDHVIAPQDVHLKTRPSSSPKAQCPIEYSFPRPDEPKAIYLPRSVRIQGDRRV
jgi:hypothetical protein